MSAIYTFGYEGHSLGGFLLLMQEYAVQLVIDVRETPLCRENPAFDKFALIKALRASFLDYIYLKPLSSTQEMRDLKKEECGTLRYFQLYERHLQRHSGLIREIVRETQGLNLCLLCRENDPETCHRTIIADYLQKESAEPPRLQHLI